MVVVRVVLVHWNVIPSWILDAYLRVSFLLGIGAQMNLLPWRSS